MSAGPKRLPKFPYRGRYCYFVTCCTHARAHLFLSAAPVSLALEQMLSTADEQCFAVRAYCFMPDHLHALFQGQSAASDFRALMTIFRRRAACAHARTFRTRLWQVGYYEHVLREGESPRLVARYIAVNAVRAGLVKRAEEYPYCRVDADFAEWLNPVDVRPD